MMTDREKIIKALTDALTAKENYPWAKAEMSFEFIEMLLELLKEQEAVVRCKDCKYWSSERINDFNKCRRWINVGVKNFATMGDWFCADGERKLTL